MNMEIRKILSAATVLALLAGASAPAFAQNRFMDEARAAADRRAENKAVREAEHPVEEARPATATASTATPAPAETEPAAQSATPATTPAPAQ